MTDTENLINLFRSGTTVELNDAIADLTKRFGKRESERIYERALKIYDRECDCETEPESPSENATARQVAERWRASALANETGDDRVTWFAVKAFADQVLAVLDREEAGGQYDLSKASDPAERAEWARLNVRTTLRNAQAAIDEAVKAFDVAERDRERVEKRAGHSCPNCSGIDPNSCLMNPERTV